MITITHSYVDGTLLDGTTKAEGQRGHQVRAILDTYNWKWFRSLGCWGQRSSQDKPSRRGRIEPTAAALRALGIEVTVMIDDTPQDMATAEQHRADQADARADALRTKSERRAAEADRLSRAADAVLDPIPLGQPNIVDSRGRSPLRNVRERAYAKERKAHELGREAEELAERADTAGAAMRHRYNPITVANRIKDLEATLRRGNVREEYRAKCERDLTYWREVRAEQIADGQVVEYTPDMLARGGLVKGWVGSTWWEIEKVNRTTVTIRTHRSAVDRDKWLTNKLELHRITGYLSPEEIAERKARQGIDTEDDNDG